MEEDFTMNRWSKLAIVAVMIMMGLFVVSCTSDADDDGDVAEDTAEDTAEEVAEEIDTPDVLNLYNWSEYELKIPLAATRICWANSKEAPRAMT
jgi:hypothetical protein